MINVLSYIGMNVHSEVCLWTLLGLMRTIFDATLFRVNANLKQVWQMSMPEELSMPVQRVLRTMISGVMLVQCFTVYVYLASYIVVLYPVFLEERPNLVVPWLLLAAVRKLLCELMSLALGLGTCVLLGPARPPCIKFVIIKLISIMPAVYMWMLMYSYYHTLKVAAAFKTFPAALPTCDQDYGLELAIRRRKTKSLLGEAQLRSKLVASLYTYGEERPDRVTTSVPKIGIASRMIHSTGTSALDIIKVDEDTEVVRPNSLISNRMSETGSYEDWFGSEVVLPRGSDRILEQFVLMLLRIGAYLNKEGSKSESSHMLTCKSSYSAMPQQHDINCMGMNSSDDTDTPLLVSSSKEKTAQYLREYPHIFMRRTFELRNDNTADVTNVQTRQENENNSTTKNRKRAVTVSSKETVFTAAGKGVKSIKHDPVHSRNSNSNIQSTSKLKNTDEIILKYTDISINQSSYRKMNECSRKINTNQSSESIINVCPEKTSINQNASNNINESSKTICINEISDENIKIYSTEMNINQSSDSKINSYPEKTNINQSSVKHLNERPEDMNTNQTTNNKYSNEMKVSLSTNNKKNSGLDEININQTFDKDSSNTRLENVNIDQDFDSKTHNCPKKTSINQTSEINSEDCGENISTRSSDDKVNEFTEEMSAKKDTHNKKSNI